MQLDPAFREGTDGSSDWALSRRDFLERTAHAAGLAGMAASLPASVILAEAADG
jgi:hypothetical protein